MHIQRLEPPIPLKTPLGAAKAYMYIDRGREEFGEWVCFLSSDGTSWTFIDPDIRLWDVPTDHRFEVAPFRNAEKWRALHARVTGSDAVVPIRRPV